MFSQYSIILTFVCKTIQQLRIELGYRLKFYILNILYDFLDQTLIFKRTFLFSSYLKLWEKLFIDVFLVYLGMISQHMWKNILHFIISVMFYWKSTGSEIICDVKVINIFWIMKKNTISSTLLKSLDKKT